MPLPTKQELQAEFHVLKKSEVALLAKLQPVLDRYNEVRKQEEDFTAKYVKPIVEEMRPIKEDLHKVQMEIGGIVKYLRGSNGIADTGDAPVAEAAKKKQ